MRHEAVTGDVVAIKTLIADIAVESPVLGATLGELAENFDYDQIIALLDQLDGVKGI